MSVHHVRFSYFTQKSKTGAHIFLFVNLSANVKIRKEISIIFLFFFYIWRIAKFNKKKNILASQETDIFAHKAFIRISSRCFSIIIKINSTLTSLHVINIFIIPSVDNENTKKDHGEWEKHYEKKNFNL